jgi:hypothetical protein
VTIEQRADNAAVEHSGKRLMMIFGVPFSNDFFAVGKTENPQTFLVFYAAAETNSVRGEDFLERFFFIHNNLGCVLSMVFDVSVFCPMSQLIKF